jgi:hypothetical protein
MFTVHENVTFVLENNITLQGHNGNNGVMVKVSGGSLKMNTGAVITGNSGNGVTVGENYSSNGIFTMSGGTISGNTLSGVYVSSRGTFTMITDFHV